MKYLTSLAFIATCSPVHAQLSCADVDLVRNAMIEKYSEELQVSGLSHNGFIVEFWGNTEKGNWTVIQTSPSGVSCIMSHGSDFNRVVLRGNL